MKFRFIPALLACCLCVSFPIQSFAEDTDEMPVDSEILTDSEEVLIYSEIPVEWVESADNTRSSGLISSFYITCSVGKKTLYITAETSCNDTMAELGFTDIQIQRSTNKTDWTDERTVTDYVIYNNTSCKLKEYAVSVQGGYYYRVVLKHYAKENTWWFPDEEYCTNTSYEIWVPKV